MPNLAGPVGRAHEHQPPHQPCLPQSLPVLPPLSLALSHAVTPGDQQTLHHYHNHAHDRTDLHQDKTNPSSLQQAMPHQDQPPRYLNQQKSQPKTSATRKPISLPSPEEAFHSVEEELDSECEDKQNKKAGRKKIKIQYIDDKSRRHITFSKRKAGIMKKAYELSTLTGTQILLLVVSETGLVYTFTTPKLQPLVTKPEGKNLIQSCLNAHDLIPATPESSSPSPLTSQQAFGNDTYTKLQSHTTNFYDDRRHPHTQSYLPTPLPNYAPLSHLGYNAPYFQTHPLAHFPLGAGPAYLNAGFPYSPLPQFSQYSASNNASYLNPATFWPQSNPSSPTSSSSTKMHHHYPPNTSESHQSEFQDGLQFPSPPTEGFKEWENVTTSAQPTTPGETP